MPGPKTTAKLIKTGTGVAKYFATQNKPAAKKPSPPPGAKKIATAKLPAKQPAPKPVPRPAAKKPNYGDESVEFGKKYDSKQPTPTAPAVTTTYTIMGKQFPKKAVHWTAGVGTFLLACWGGYELSKAIRR